MAIRLVPLIALAAGLLVSTQQSAAENRIDTQLPGAPELAAYGEYTVGVRTIELTNPGQVDVLQLDNASPLPEVLPTSDRSLTVEVWYPADQTASGSNNYRVLLRDGTTEVDLKGQALRDAAPILNDGPFPLAILSHGYPGNRYLMSHLAENLASKGYVVASIDHTDSTYEAILAFGSTLVNRSLDQIFVLNEMERMNNDSTEFLNNLVDTANTGIVGYSMGGYGAVITAGAGVTQASIDYTWGAPHGTLGIHKSGSQTHADLIDPRVRTAIAFAPWGMNTGFWDAEGLTGIGVPMLFIAGSQDDVSGYEIGIRAIWEGATSVERALLTFDNANHNAGAPYPAPEESFAFSDDLGFYPYEHYADAVWDTARMNNISQHFATAWLGKYLKSEANAQSYLDLTENSNDGNYDQVDGTFTEAHTYWNGFADRTAKGMHFEWLQATTSPPGCDYTDADSNGGFGWNDATKQSCPPLADNNCDYTDADKNGGWGWNPVDGTSCSPE